MAANTKVRVEGSKNLIDAAQKYNVKKSSHKVLASCTKQGKALLQKKHH